MLKTEYCSLSDIPEMKKGGSGPKNRKLSHGKWWKILRDFIDSGEEVCKVTPDDISARNCAIGLSQYIKKHDFPIGYAQRGDSVYIFRKS